MDTRKKLLVGSAYTLMLMLSASAYFTLYYIFSVNFYLGTFILGLIGIFLTILLTDGDLIQDV